MKQRLLFVLACLALFVTCAAPVGASPPANGSNVLTFCSSGCSSPSGSTFHCPVSGLVVTRSAPSSIGRSRREGSEWICAQQETGDR